MSHSPSPPAPVSEPHFLSTPRKSCVTWGPGSLPASDASPWGQRALHSLSNRFVMNSRPITLLLKVRRPCSCNSLPALYLLSFSLALKPQQTGFPHCTYKRWSRQTLSPVSILTLRPSSLPSSPCLPRQQTCSSSFPSLCPGPLLPLASGSTSASPVGPRTAGTQQFSYTPV